MNFTVSERLSPTSIYLFNNCVVEKLGFLFARYGFRRVGGCGDRCRYQKYQRRNGHNTGIEGKQSPRVYRDRHIRQIVHLWVERHERHITFGKQQAQSYDIAQKQAAAYKTHAHIYENATYERLSRTYRTEYAYHPDAFEN